MNNKFLFFQSHTKRYQNSSPSRSPSSQQSSELFTLVNRVPSFRSQVELNLQQERSTFDVNEPFKIFVVWSERWLTHCLMAAGSRKRTVLSFCCQGFPPLQAGVRFKISAFIQTFSRFFTLFSADVSSALYLRFLEPLYQFR